MANTPSNRLSDTVRDARIKAGLSLRDLAKELRISASYISDIENDRRVPSEDVLRQLAEILKLDADDLLAKAGRVGDQAERYLKQNPTVGMLFRQISDQQLEEKDLQALLAHAKELGLKKGGT